ncbi:flagellar biosynthetic protein FliO [Melioribacter roseus P3M-2]|uniref:Flagellar biosynthetic protein FliO n=1 Tax=Melioribacter roseus (strain DSM 23840 / JCM 17771 / VKM B-2668 / P3M-2) TaxID=1191523 RepID=I6YXT4_MELRP|nr:flagellar biosynthetic protein FliO [Melioribacter roseus]AFN75372.1 flagellar biosynthetic protein FliO [Melioribacter roseus P3M-2]
MSAFDITQALLPLILVIMILGITLYFVKRYTFTMKGGKRMPLKIEVLSNQLIMPKKYLSIVRVEDKIMLLGVSEAGITLIKEFDSIDLPDNNETQNGDNQKKSFYELLKQNLGMR